PQYRATAGRAQCRRSPADLQAGAAPEVQVLGTSDLVEIARAHVVVLDELESDPGIGDRAILGYRGADAVRTRTVRMCGEAARVVAQAAQVAVHPAVVQAAGETAADIEPAAAHVEALDSSSERIARHGAAV